MNTKLYFYITLILSVIVQIITGVLEMIALFIKVESPFMILHLFSFKMPILNE